MLVSYAPTTSLTYPYPMFSTVSSGKVALIVNVIDDSAGIEIVLSGSIVHHSHQLPDVYTKGVKFTSAVVS